METQTIRKELIDTLVKDLQTHYDTNDFDDLLKAANDRGIKVVVTKKVIVDTAIYHAGRKKWYILTRHSLFQDETLRSLAHEFSHAFLNHRAFFPEDEAEAEAEYFEESLYGPTLNLKLRIEALYRFVINPIAVKKFVCSPAYSHEYNRMLMKRFSDA